MWAVTLCCRGKPLICVDDGNIARSSRWFGESLNPRALQIVRLCEIAHERQHLNHIDCSCQDTLRPNGNITKPGWKPPYRIEDGDRQAEIEAYTAEYGCLIAKTALCGGDPDCEEDLEQAIEKVSRALLMLTGRRPTRG